MGLLDDLEPSPESGAIHPSSIPLLGLDTGGATEGPRSVREAPVREELDRAPGAHAEARIVVVADGVRHSSVRPGR